MFSNFIDQVRLPFRKDKEFITSLYEILGFYPHNLEIYRIALAHKSHAYRNKKGRPLNNERLEFLGDAILEAVVSDIVYHRYERKREGFLTSTRSKIVQRSMLNRLANELKLEKLIAYSVQTGAHNNYICGNAFEALVGAAYLDRGYKYCKWFVEKQILGKLVDIDGVANEEVNFKSKLLEWSQKNRINIQYNIEDSEMEGSNSPVFKSSITIEGLRAGEGSGYSKKESQQNAAKEALTKLKKQPQFLEQIFQEKEKRTAMEAPEICALPDLPELLAEPQEEVAKKKPHRGRGKARRAPGKEETTPSAEKTVDKESKRTPERGKNKEDETKGNLTNEKRKPATPKRRSKPQQTSPAAPTSTEKTKEEIIQAAENAAFEKDNA